MPRSSSPNPLLRSVIEAAITQTVFAAPPVAESFAQNLTIILERDDIIQRFIFEVARDGKRHPHYQRTVAGAALFKKLATGEGIETLLKKFARRESEELFKQRVEITQHVAPATIKNILDVFQKVPRSNYRRILAYPSGKDQKAADLEAILAKFWGDESLDDWCATRLLELNTTDPNAFVAIDFKPFDHQKQRAAPYPFEISSASAVDYLIENKRLRYLVARTEIAAPRPKMSARGIFEKPKKERFERFTLYLDDQTITLTEIEQKPAAKFMSKNVLTETTDGTFIFFEKGLFRFEAHLPHGAGFVPAFQVGYFRDLATDGETFLPPFAAAIPYLMKALKINSEFDLTAALVAFPLSIRFAPDCTASGCDGGRVGDSKCSVCAGTGKQRPTSVQEEILISMPMAGDAWPQLDNLVIFKAPPVEILVFQKEYLDHLTEMAKKVVFNSDTLTKKQVSETATGQNIDLQNVYDALYPFAKKFAAAWQKAVESVAKFTDLDAGLIAQIVINRDFKLKTRDELMGELAAAHDAGAGPAIRVSIERDLVRAMMIDTPEEYLRWQVREYFNPFSGKDAAEIALSLSSANVPRSRKVLYENFNQIFDDIEADAAGGGIDFYRLEKNKQTAIVAKKVADLVAEIDGATAAAAPSLFTATDGGGK